MTGYLICKPRDGRSARRAVTLGLATLALLLTVGSATAAPLTTAQSLAGRATGLGPGSDLRSVSTLFRGEASRGTRTGAPCPSESGLRSFVDSYLSTPHPRFPGRGSTVPGLSVSLSTTGCGTVTYAAGQRNVEEGKQMTPATLMGLASMTKPVIAAVTLKLNETGTFGPAGLDTTVDRLLTPSQIAELTVGDDPLHPRCPGSTYLLNRQTLAFEWTTFSCPDLSQVTLRHLMLSNHGMYDFLNEVIQPSGFFQYSDGLFFELRSYLGLNPTPPVSSKNGFDYLKAFGLKGVEDAVIGGNLATRDLEFSFGNTGFQLLGVILEQRTGKSIDELVADLIVKPLRIDDMVIYVDPDKRRSLIADGYDVVTGVSLFEATGVYPLVRFNDHTAVNTLSLGLGHPGNVDLAGGAGGLIANMKSYRAFLDAFVNGNLLGPSARATLEGSYLHLPDISTSRTTYFNGFGLIKRSVRGSPMEPDSDILYHPGRLPGISCENAVVRRPGATVARGTFAACINGNRNAYPDAAAIWFELVRRINETDLAAEVASGGTSARHHLVREAP